jgi:hypothetical protein
MGDRSIRNPISRFLISRFQITRFSLTERVPLGACPAVSIPAGFPVRVPLLACPAVPDVAGLTASLGGSLNVLDKLTVAPSRGSPHPQAWPPCAENDAARRRVYEMRRVPLLACPAVSDVAGFSASLSGSPNVLDKSAAAPARGSPHRQALHPRAENDAARRRVYELRRVPLLACPAVPDVAGLTASLGGSLDVLDEPAVAPSRGPPHRQALPSRAENDAARRRVYEMRRRRLRSIPARPSAAGRRGRGGT